MRSNLPPEIRDLVSKNLVSAPARDSEIVMKSAISIIYLVLEARFSLVADTTTVEQPSPLAERITTELRSYLIMPRLPPTADSLSYYSMTFVTCPSLGMSRVTGHAVAFKPKSLS